MDKKFVTEILTKIYEFIIIIDKKNGEIVYKKQNKPFDFLEIKTLDELQQFWKELLQKDVEPIFLIFQDYFILRNTIDNYIYYTIQKSKYLSSFIENSKNSLMFDELTKCYTKSQIKEFLLNYLARFVRYKEEKFSILMFDIDFFKKINDTYGHLCGDYILSRLSSIVKNALRTSDICGRFGGEEFLIILPNTKIPGALKLANRIRSLVKEQTFVCKDKEIKITISIGITSAGTTDSYYSLVERCDEALYMAKRNGRDRIEYK